MRCLHARFDRRLPHHNSGPVPRTRSPHEMLRSSTLRGSPRRCCAHRPRRAPAVSRRPAHSAGVAASFALGSQSVRRASLIVEIVRSALRLADKP